jgi:hypothetical protein
MDKEIRLERLKTSIICREINRYEINEDIITTYKPKAGDAAIFEVISIGKHPSIQGTNGNNRHLYPGDYIMCVFGARYATGQIEGYVPDKYYENYQILGKGGVVGIMTSMHASLLKKGATQVKLIGYLTNNGKVINTKYLTQKRMRFNPNKKRKLKVILSLGASMDSGKTTSAAYLCRGILASGTRVAYFKLTGTVYGKDKAMVRDCGALFVADFGNYGFPSTYMCSKAEMLDLYENLMSITEKENIEYVVVEIADGLLQRETNMLIKDKAFMSTVHSILFSGGDSLSALLGFKMLEDWGYKPSALSGLFTASPLLVREVEEEMNIPILTLDKLSSPEVLSIFENSPLLNKNELTKLYSYS